MLQSRDTITPLDNGASTLVTSPEFPFVRLSSFRAHNRLLRESLTPYAPNDFPEAVTLNYAGERHLTISAVTLAISGLLQSLQANPRKY
jgi:hypothetical protein